MRALNSVHKWRIIRHAAHRWLFCIIRHFDGSVREIFSLRGTRLLFATMNLVNDPNAQLFF